MNLEEMQIECPNCKNKSIPISSNPIKTCWKCKKVYFWDWKTMKAII